ncbi:MAG: hypothetical protein QHJ73_11725, partial [Armatimonadota bacterium]|nr:hypothetical protein [Armatimonadota bacterium]
LTALLGSGLSASTQGLRALEDIDAPEPKSPPDYSRVFAQIRARKEAILRDFRAITPVPLPCRTLHQTYGTYLATTLKAIAELQATIGSATASPAAPLAALPIGSAAEAAKAAADAQEAAIRKFYNIPKNPLDVLP